jgi:hypothetical protein
MEHSLQPLTFGNILIVGAKASNFDIDLRQNPRVIIWSSQETDWQGKDLPQNVRAVFMTRWIGHVPFANIVREAKKKQITIFNPEGTGVIARQVRELLDMHKLTKVNEVNQTMTTTTETPNSDTFTGTRSKNFRKLFALIPFIDEQKNNSQNARALVVKAQELGISTTFGSLSIFVSKHRKKSIPTHARHARSVRPVSPSSPNNDVAVEMLDHLIKEMQDLRSYYISTVRENSNLKSKLAKFRKLVAE